MKRNNSKAAGDNGDLGDDKDDAAGRKLVMLIITMLSCSIL